MTFNILTDSTADLDEKWAQENKVELVGLTITLDDIAYETVGPNRLTSDRLLERMQEGSQPTTSQVNVGQFEEVFRRHAKNGDALLYIAFSSVLSGTYQSAVIARDMILDEYPEAIIEIVDTLAAAARDQGKSLSETKAMIEDILPRLRTYFLVDDLYHLMRGGRLSKSSAIIGSLINIKPLLWLDASGKLVPLAKIRGRKKAIKEMVLQATQDIGHSTAIVAYANDIEATENLKEQLLAVDGIEKVLIMPLGPVISTHVGPDTLAVFTIGKEAR